MQLAVQSIFNPMGAGEFSEIAAVEYYLQCLSSLIDHMHGDIHLDRTINGGKVSITLGFSAKDSEEYSSLCRTLKASLIIPCEINGKKLYAVIKLPENEGDVCKITVHTEEEFEKLREEAEKADIKRDEAKDRKSDLIGKYVPVSDIEFVETDEVNKKGYIQFRAYSIEDAGYFKTIEDIKIDAQRADPSIFERFETSLPEIDEQISKTLQNIPEENRFILSPNQYGIDGIGRQDIIAVVRPLMANRIAVFHEAAHAAVNRETAAGVTGKSALLEHLVSMLFYKGCVGAEALDKYLKEKTDEYEIDQDKVEEWERTWRVHYALRLFQRQQWFLEDFRLTETIRILGYIVEDMDEEERAYLLDEAHVGERFGMFVQLFSEREERLGIRLDDQGERRTNLDVAYRRLVESEKKSPGLRRYAREELDEKKSAYVFDEDHPDRAERFTEICAGLQKEMHVDGSDKKQRAKLLNTAYQIVKVKEGGWNTAQQVITFMRDDLGFDFQKIKWATKSELMTAVYGISHAKQGTFSFWKGFIGRLSERFGIGLIGEISEIPRKKIAVTAYYVAKTKDPAASEERFYKAIEIIKDRFGFTEEKIINPESEGGLKTTQKTRIMTTAYSVAVSQHGLDVFEATLDKIDEIFGITAEDMKKDKEEGGISFEDKASVMTAAYAVSKKKDGQEAFAKAVGVISDIFGISPEELKEKEGDGGLALDDKLHFISAAYTLIQSAEGLNNFRDVIKTIGATFGISLEEMKKKEGDGGLALAEKHRLLTASFFVATKKDGLDKFQEVIGKIQEIFGLEKDDLVKAEEEGGLVIKEKLRLITAAYEVVHSTGGLETFEGAIEKIQENFGITPEDMRKIEVEGGLTVAEKLKIVTAAYSVAFWSSLDVFEAAIQRIGEIFGIDPFEMKLKEEEGGLALDEKLRLITAAYGAVTGVGGLEVFEGVIERISAIFGIAPEEMSKKEEEGGLALAEKLRLITAAYATAHQENGLEIFEGTLEAISRTFGISPEEMRKKKEEGGLTLKEKLRLITAAYGTAVGQGGTEVFSGVLEKITEIFGISYETMLRKENEGGLSIPEKLRLIAAAYGAASLEGGAKAFEDTAAKVSEIFGISPEEMFCEEDEGGLALSDRIRLITALANVAGEKNGPKKFEAFMTGVTDLFGISGEELRSSKEDGGLDREDKFRVITAGYQTVSARGGQEAFEKVLALITGTFGISPDDMKKSGGDSAVSLDDKLSAMTAAYCIVRKKGGSKTFETFIKKLDTTFGITPGQLKKGKEEGGLDLPDKMQLLTAAYEVANISGGLKIFENAADAIANTLGVDEGFFSRTETEGGLSLGQKITVITIGYELVLAENGVKTFREEASGLGKGFASLKLSEKIYRINVMAYGILHRGMGSKDEISGLIGKYAPITDIQFIETDTRTRKGYIRFKAYHIEDLEKKEVEITIDAQRGPPGLFENYRRTGIPEIDSALGNTLSTIPQNNRFILLPNEYGIDGIGTRELLAIVKPFENNRIALFHETGQAAIDIELHKNTESPLLERITRDLIYKGEIGERALDKYLEAKADGYKVPANKKREWKQVRLPHYALRLFQKQEWFLENFRLTEMIRILNDPPEERILRYVTTELDEKKQLYLLNERHVDERLGLFAEIFNGLEEQLCIDINDSEQRKRLLDVSYQIVGGQIRAWNNARKTILYLRQEMGFDFTKVKWEVKSKLMTIIYGVSRSGGEATFDYWKAFLERLKERFGIDSFKGIEDELRQKIVTAAFHITRGKEAREALFNSVVEKIMDIFGFTALSEPRSKGGLKLAEKIFLITVAYSIVIRDGSGIFKNAVKRIEEVFAITPAERILGYVKTELDEEERSYILDKEHVSERSDLFVKNFIGLEEQSGVDITDKSQRRELLSACYKKTKEEIVRREEVLGYVKAELDGRKRRYLLNKKHFSERFSLFVEIFNDLEERSGMDIADVRQREELLISCYEKTKWVTARKAEVLKYVKTGLDRKKSSYILDELHFSERFDPFVKIFDDLEGRLHIDITDSGQRERLLNVCYKIVEGKATAWTTAQKVLRFLEQDMGFDFAETEWAVKSRLMTIAYGISRSRENTFDYWQGFLGRLKERFGMDPLRKIEDEPRQKIVTAAFYVSRGKEDREGLFNSAIGIIEDGFGIDEEELKKPESEGGLKTADKVLLITAAYNIATKDVLEIFKNAVMREASRYTPEQIRDMGLSDKVSLMSSILPGFASSAAIPQWIPAGLIGKYMPVTDIEFIETDTKVHKGFIRFKAYHIEDPEKKEIEIAINAERAPPGMFEECGTDNPEIDATLKNIVAGVDESNRFILEPNQYGIHGIGTRQILAIVRPLSNDRIALFHEIMHVLIDKEIHESKDGKSFLLEQIAGMIIHTDRMELVYTGTDALDKYLTRMTYKYKVPREEREKWKQYWRAHYGLRLFQKTIALEEDSALTRKIRILDYILAELDEEARSYIFDETEVHERFGLFVEVFNTLARMAGIDINNYSQSRNLPPVQELLSICYANVMEKTGGTEKPAEPVTEEEQEIIGRDEPEIIVLTESETARKAEILRYIETELDKRQDKERAIERLNLFVRVFVTLEQELYLDITKKTERKRLLGVCYQIVCRKATAWPEAQEVLAYLRDDMGFDYKAVKWVTKSALMTIIYGIAQGREGIFESWKHFTGRLMECLGLESIQEVVYPPRQRIATAAFYVTRGSEANRDSFAEAILDIELLFGITREDLKEKEPLKLSEKLTIITAAQKVATTAEGNAKFRDAVREMSDIFNIKEERRHLEIPDKVRLITAVYETMTIKDGIRKFKDAVIRIDDIFDITEDELRQGLDIAEKIKVITAAYHIARATDGMNIFEETIKKIGEKFNITDDRMKGISGDGSEGLALHDKIRLITAGYAVALGAHSEGLEVFSRAVTAIGDIFGISDDEMKGIASEGRAGLVLSDRIRLITAGYQAAQSVDGVNQFRRTVKGIKDIFDISDDALKKEMELSDKLSVITAAYHINLAARGLSRFEGMIQRDLMRQIPGMPLTDKVGHIKTYASRVRWSGVKAEELATAGLIGKYMPVTDIEFIETDPETRKGIIRFKAYHIEDPRKSEVEITINAGRAPPGTFDNYPLTGIPEIDKKLLITLVTRIPLENRYILEPNQYGIDGIGTRKVLAVAKPFANNGVALFHEICHSAIDEERRQTLDGSSALLEEIISRLEYKDEKGEKALDIYLEEKADKYKVPEDARVGWKKTWQIHYALRLFLRQGRPGEDQELTKEIKILNWAAAELDEKKRAYLFDEGNIHERFVLFAEIFNGLEEKLNMDANDVKQRKRLLYACYQIAEKEETGWDRAQRALSFLDESMGFDYTKMKWGTKRKLISVIYGVGERGEDMFDYWKDFLGRIGKQFGIDDFRRIDVVSRQKIATAAFYIARGSETKEARFNEAMQTIRNKFGISENELKRDESEGGLELEEKVRFITASYAVASRKTGPEAFEKAIDKIGSIFGITPAEMKKKEEKGGLPLVDKIRLITAAYHVAQARDGVEAFEQTIRKMGKIFGITAGEMKLKEEEGGLSFTEKASFVTAGYVVAMGGKNGLKMFESSIKEVSNIFGITPEEMKEKEEDGGLSLEDKLRVITAGYQLSRVKNGARVFSRSATRIGIVFGITPEDMKRKEDEGGLALIEKIRLITAAYHIATAENGIKMFEESIEKIGDNFGITRDDMRMKEKDGGLPLSDKISLITAAYALTHTVDALKIFDETIARISRLFGITPEEMKSKEEEGGLELEDKVSLIVAAYHVARVDALESFKGIIAKVSDIFGITQDMMTKSEKEGGLSLEYKIRLVSAAYQVATSRKGLKMFDEAIVKISETFGITPDEMEKEKEEGGLTLGDKFKLLSGGYRIVASRGGVKAFDGVITKISGIFGISMDEMRNKEQDGGLALSSKLRLLSAAYRACVLKAGPVIFEEATGRIGGIFGITPEEMRNSEGEGGLALSEKIRLITSVTSLTDSRRSLKEFEAAISKIGNIFGITRQMMKNTKEKGGLALSDKMRLITAGYEVATKDKVKLFEEVIGKISSNFGISPDKMKNDFKNGGLPIDDKLHIIAAAYEVVHSVKGPRMFEKTIEKINEIYGITPEEIKNKEKDGGLALSDKMRLIAAVSHIAPNKRGLRIFEEVRDKIEHIFGMTKEQFKGKESEGGFPVSYKIRILTATYTIIMKNGLEVFSEGVTKIGDIFGITPDETKRTESKGGLSLADKLSLIKSAYRLVIPSDGLEAFDQVTTRIEDVFGISPEKMKKKEYQGGLPHEQKLILIMAISEIAATEDGANIFEKETSSYSAEEISAKPLSERIGCIRSVASRISWGKISLTGEPFDLDGTEKPAIHKPDPRNAAEGFVTSLFNLSLNMEKDEKMLLALDKDLGREGTGKDVRKIIKEICQVTKNGELKKIFSNLVIVEGRGKVLAREVSQYTGTGKDGIKINKSNVIMLTKASNAENCEAFKDEAIVTFVDDSKLDIMDYYPVVEMALFSIAKALYHRGLTAYDKDKLASLYRSCHGEELDMDKILSECVEKRVFTIVLQPAEPFEYEELRDIYESLQEFLRAA